MLCQQTAFYGTHTRHSIGKQKLRCSSFCDADEDDITKWLSFINNHPDPALPPPHIEFSIMSVHSPNKKITTSRGSQSQSVYCGKYL